MEREAIRRPKERDRPETSRPASVRSSLLDRAGGAVSYGLREQFRTGTFEDEATLHWDSIKGLK